MENTSSVRSSNLKTKDVHTHSIRWGRGTSFFYPSKQIPNTILYKEAPFKVAWQCQAFEYNTSFKSLNLNSVEITCYSRRSHKSASLKKSLNSNFHLHPNSILLRFSTPLKNYIRKASISASLKMLAILKEPMLQHKLILYSLRIRLFMDNPFTCFRRTFT